MRSRPIIRRLSIGIVIVVFLAAVGQLVLRQVSTGPIRRSIEQNLSEALGLEVEIDDTTLALLPTPHLEAEGVRVANLPDRQTPSLLSIERLDLGFEIWPLTRGVLAIDSLQIAGADLHLELDDQGQLVTSHKLSALLEDDEGDSIDVELRELEVERLRVSFRDGRDGTTYSLDLESVDLDPERFGDGMEIAIRGEFEGSPVVLNGQIGALSALLDDTRPFPIEVEGQLFEALFGATGSIRQPARLAGIELDIRAEIPELVIQGQALPELGAIQINGHLSDLDGSLGLERLSLNTAPRSAVRIESSGAIDDLLALEEVDVETGIETDSSKGSLGFLTRLLEPWTDVALPALESLSAKTKLSHDGSGLTLDGQARWTTAGESIVMHAEGAVRNLTGAPALDLRVELAAPDLAAITALVPAIGAHGAFGPVRGSARLHGQAGKLSASEIALLIGERDKAWGELDGHATDLVAFQGVELELSFGAESLHHLRELLSHELPETAALAGSAKLSDKDGQLGFEHLRLHSAEEGPVEIHLEARFDDLPGRNEIDVDLRLRGENARHLGALIGVELLELGPVEFKGRLAGSDERLSADEFTLQLGETFLTGNVQASFAPGDRPSLVARIDSEHVHLEDLGLRSAKSDAPPSATGARSELLTEAGLHRPLPFEELRHVDLDLAVVLDAVTGYESFHARNIRFGLGLDDGHLHISDAGAHYKGGQVLAELRADARTPIPGLVLDVTIDDMDLRRLISQFREDTDYAGTLDLDLDLQARGRTLDALRRSLAGHARGSIRQGNIASKVGQEFVFNILEAARLTPRRDRLPVIGCSVARMTIEHGVAHVETLVVRNADIEISANGQIDLVAGRYDLEVVPRPAKPGFLSMTPEVFVRGTLDDPSFQMRKATLATSFGRSLVTGVTSVGRKLIQPFRSLAGEEGLVVDDCSDIRPEES